MTDGIPQASSRLCVCGQFRLYIGIVNRPVNPFKVVKQYIQLNRIRIECPVGAAMPLCQLHVGVPATDIPFTDKDSGILLRRVLIDHAKRDKRRHRRPPIDAHLTPVYALHACTHADSCESSLDRSVSHVMIHPYHVIHFAFQGVMTFWKNDEWAPCAFASTSVSRFTSRLFNSFRVPSSKAKLNAAPRYRRFGNWHRPCMSRQTRSCTRIKRWNAAVLPKPEEVKARLSHRRNNRLNSCAANSPLLPSENSYRK